MALTFRFDLDIFSLDLHAKIYVCIFVWLAVNVVKDTLTHTQTDDVKSIAPATSQTRDVTSMVFCIFLFASFVSVLDGRVRTECLIYYRWYYKLMEQILRCMKSLQNSCWKSNSNIQGKVFLSNRLYLVPSLMGSYLKNVGHFQSIDAHDPFQ